MCARRDSSLRYAAFRMTCGGRNDYACVVDAHPRIHGGRLCAGGVGMGSRLRRPLHNHHSGPEPESRGGDLGLNPMPILSNMVSH